MGYLYDDSHSIAYWTSAIASWMQPIYAQLTNGLVSETDIIPIVSGLNEVISSGGNTSYTPYLKYGGKSNSQWLSDTYTLLNNCLKVVANYSNVHLYSPTAAGGYNDQTYSRAGYGFIENLYFYINSLTNQQALIYSYEFNHRDRGFNTSQTALNWTDIDSSYTFTPNSSTDGLYKWLATIQAPVARLSYVLASDERIEAQEASAANEQAVVDNFIDSNGAGSASPSDIGSISDLSSGYQNNFGSSASVTGIFDIFDSNNFGWFSQETANQFDTSSNNSRAKSGSEFETPLLDQRINDIYDALGVKP